MAIASLGTAHRSPFRRALGAAATLAMLALLGVWAVTLRPQSLGGPAQYVVIHGNSMWPTYHDGDLIILHRQADAQVGDVVAYRVPRGEVGQGLVVIHRVVGGSEATGLVLRGDNNPTADPWHPHPGDVVGSTWVRVPRVGRLLVLLHRPAVPAALAAAVTVVLLMRRHPRRSSPGTGILVFPSHPKTLCGPP
jgi:signal peptidase